MEQFYEQAYEQRSFCSSENVPQFHQIELKKQEHSQNVESQQFETCEKHIH